MTWNANRSSSGPQNEILATIAGEFAAFIENGDVLAPFALYEVVKQINESPSVDLLFSDEDKISEMNHRFDPFFKPDYSPDTLRSINYMHHFLVIRKTVGDQIGWFRDGFGDSQYYDLVLRATEHTKNISHISKVLYHSCSVMRKDIDCINQDSDVGNQALQEHLERSGLQGRVMDGSYPSTYRVSYVWTDSPLVSIIIPNHDNAQYLNRAIHSILKKSTYTNFEILIVENNSRQPETFQLYEQLESLDNRISVLTQNAPFNFSVINNWATGRAKGEVLLFLNNDIEVISPNWLEEMLQHVLRPDVGAVGAKLYYEDGTIQHAGIIIGPSHGIAQHEHLKAPREAAGYFGRLTYIRNVSAVTAACVMLRKEIFDEVNRFDEHYALAYGDVDLCLKIHEKGLFNVWTPFAELYHFESKTRGYDDSPEKRARFKSELDYFLQKWHGTLKKGDPYYNTAFSMKNEDLELNLE
jgi:O-antigen biosynthesis protein